MRYGRGSARFLAVLGLLCGKSDGRVNSMLTQEQQGDSVKQRGLLQTEEKAQTEWMTAPWEDAWENSVAFCTIIRNEYLSDVREFILYHKWLGVDHIYLFENDSKVPIKEGLQDLIDKGYVTYAAHSGDAQQGPVYRLCDSLYRHKYNWLMYIDADEFLVNRDERTPLKQILNEYKAYPGLSVHWVVFGPNGHETRPEGAGSIRHCTHCNPDPHEHIKTFANSYFVESVGHPHNQWYRGEGTSVNEARYPPLYSHQAEWNEAIANCRHEHADNPEACRETQKYNKRGPAFHYEGHRSHKRLAVFHYITKSREDFEVKHSRPEAYFGKKEGSRSWADFDNISRDSNSDHPICHELADVWEKCCTDS